MGWARTLLMGDVGNRLDIADVEYDVTDLRVQLRRARDLNESQDRAIQQLQRENEQLEICIAALIQTMQGKGILTRDEVAKLVDMIEQ